VVQVLEKEKEHKYKIVLEEIIILEELPMEEERIEKPEVIKREKQPKRALKKLFNKAKFNVNYLKDTKRIEDIKNKIHFRNYAVY
jgi:hypothetical protein